MGSTRAVTTSVSSTSSRRTKLQVNTTEADLTVTLSSAATEQVLVQYSTADGTATRRRPVQAKYRASPVWPGQTTATVEVQAINLVITSSIYFDVNLSSPVGATIASGGGTGIVTINSNALSLRRSLA